jgi:hypothetical protein
MNGIASYSKAIAAGVMAVLAVVVTITGASLPEWLTEDWLLTILAVITPFVVMLIPNQN